MTALINLTSARHGDEIVFADLHFPSASIAKAASAELINLDGHPMPLILTQVLKLFPLDQYVDQPVCFFSRLFSFQQSS